MAKLIATDVTHFESAEAFSRWLEKNASSAIELWVGSTAFASPLTTSPIQSGSHREGGEASGAK